MTAEGFAGALGDGTEEYAHTAESDAPLRARDLGAEHHGWLVEYVTSRSSFPGPSKRVITLIGVRRWTYEGVDRVGLLADEPGPFRGTEYHLLAETHVTLVRHISKGVPRLRKNDYPGELPHA